MNDYLNQTPSATTRNSANAFLSHLILFPYEDTVWKRKLFSIAFCFSKVRIVQARHLRIDFIHTRRHFSLKILNLHCYVCLENIENIFLAIKMFKLWKIGHFTCSFVWMKCNFNWEKYIVQLNRKPELHCSEIMDSIKDFDDDG